MQNQWCNKYLELIFFPDTIKSFVRGRILKTDPHICYLESNIKVFQQKISNKYFHDVLFWHAQLGIRLSPSILSVLIPEMHRETYACVSSPSLKYESCIFVSREKIVCCCVFARICEGEREKVKLRLSECPRECILQ